MKKIILSIAAHPVRGKELSMKMIKANKTGEVVEVCEGIKIRRLCR